MCCERNTSSMRTLLLIPVGLAIVIAGGLVLCKLMGFDPHTPQMLLAAGSCLIGSVAGAVPLWFVRNGTQYSVSQSALLGMMTHMFLCVGAAAVIMLGDIAGGLRLSLVFWLMACFAVTLAVLAAAYVKRLRAARVEPASETHRP